MIAGFLFNRYLAWIFLGDALTTAAAVLLIALFIKEPAPSEDQIAKSFAEDQGLERAEKGSLLKVLLKRPSLVAFMFIHVEQRCSLFFTCWNNGPREARTRSRSRIQPLDFRNAI
jgi:hypothetical protein